MTPSALLNGFLLVFVILMAFIAGILLGAFLQSRVRREQRAQFPQDGVLALGVSKAPPSVKDALENHKAGIDAAHEKLEALASRIGFRFDYIPARFVVIPTGEGLLGDRKPATGSPGRPGDPPGAQN